MGLFHNYVKPGPGIEKDVPKRTGFPLYAELFSRHFWDLIKSNMLYALVSIPMFVILYYGSYFMNVFSFDGIPKDFSSVLCTFYAVVLLVVLGSGPASAGLAYTLRCFAREEHCFLLMDFFEKFKQNLKQSIIVTIIDVLLYVVCLPVAIKSYYQTYQSTSSNLWYFLLIFTIAIAIIYAVMHIYFYQFIITYQLKLKDALKNSLIMTVVCLPATVLLTAFMVGLSFLMASYLDPLVIALIMLVFGVTFLRFPTEFYASRAIERKMPKQENTEE